MAEAATLNTGVDTSAPGESSALDRPHTDPDSENLIGTVEGEPPGSSSPDAKTKADAEKDDTGTEEGKEKDEKDGEDDRFDRHPRFQELITKNRESTERIARLEGELDALKSFAPKGAEKKDEELPFVDITKKTDDELREWMQEDPKGYNANLYAQIRHELMNEYQQVRTRETTETGIKKTFDQYAKDNPDFMPMWKSGELQKYMQENPGHNAISAHILLTADKRKGESEKAFEERLKKEVKAAEEKVTKNFQAKQKARVLTGGPAAAPGTGEDHELKDTKARGGRTATLTERLLRLRGAPSS